MIDQMFLSFAIKAAAERINSLHIDTEGNTPESKFYGINIENIPVKSYHTMFCPCYILDSRQHNAGSIGPPKWEPRSKIRVYLGHSPFHTGSVALVYNPSTGHVSPQYQLTKAFNGSKKLTIFLEDRDYSRINLVDLKMSLDPLSTFRSTF